MKCLVTFEDQRFKDFGIEINGDIRLSDDMYMTPLTDTIPYGQLLKKFNLKAIINESRLKNVLDSIKETVHNRSYDIDQTSNGLVNNLLGVLEERKMILEDYIHEVLSTHDDKTIRITESVSGNEAIVKSNTVIRMRCNPYVTSDCIKWMYKKSTKREYLEYLKVYHEMAFDISASFPWIDDKSEYYVAQFDDGPTLVKYRNIDISIEHN